MLSLYKCAFINTGLPTPKTQSLRVLDSKSLHCGAWKTDLVPQLRTKYRWVSLSKHQRSYSFLESHSFARYHQDFAFNQSVLPMGVVSNPIDNNIFWKNVARSELALLNLATMKTVKCLKAGDVSKSLRYERKAATHKLQFRMAMASSRIKKGYVSRAMCKHLNSDWLELERTLDIVSDADNMLNDRYIYRFLARQIMLFDRLPLVRRYRLTDPTSANNESLRMYLRLVFIEEVAVSCQNGATDAALMVMFRRYFLKSMALEAIKRNIERRYVPCIGELSFS